MKLSYKIFTASLLVSFLILISNMVVVRFYLFRDFKEMESHMMGEMFAVLSDDLAIEYQKERSWDRFKNDTALFNQFVKKTLHGSRGLFPIPKPPFFGDKKIKLPHQRIALYSSGKIHIAGPSDMNKRALVFNPIMIKDKTVGFLGFQRMERMPFPFASPFFKTRMHILYTIGIILFVLSGAVTYVLSRYIMAPVDQLIQGTNALTRYQFDTRIKVRAKDELGQLARDFNHMAQTLGKYESMRKQWVMDISHELRTPLSVIKGETEAMIDGIEPLTMGQLKSIHSEKLYLEKIVNDLHMLSKADSGVLHMKRKAIQPVRLLEDTLGVYENRLAARGLVVKKALKNTQTTLFGDKDRLKRVFINIIDNTIKYSRVPGSVLFQDDIEKTRLCIRITDTGPGVAPDILDKLFDRLFRADPSRSREHGGSGLGLALCKAIIEAHQGTITAKNADSGGLEIKIELPLC